jgi:hypothetical protein
LTKTLSSVPPHTRHVLHLSWPQCRGEQSQEHPTCGGDGDGDGDRCCSCLEAVLLCIRIVAKRVSRKTVAGLFLDANAVRISTPISFSGQCQPSEQASDDRVRTCAGAAGGADARRATRTDIRYGRGLSYSLLEVIIAPCRYTSWGDFWKPVPASSDTARLRWEVLRSPFCHI